MHQIICYYEISWTQFFLYTCLYTHLEKEEKHTPYCSIIIKLKWLASKDCPQWNGRRVLNMIYPCEIEVGELCHHKVGNGIHSVALQCSRPVRSLCSVPTLSTSHDKDSWAIQGCVHLRQIVHLQPIKRNDLQISFGLQV